jgi:hypothetical protein
MVVSPDWLTLFFFPCLQYLNNTQKEKSRKVMSSSGIKFRKVQETKAGGRRQEAGGKTGNK